MKPFPIIYEVQEAVWYESVTQPNNVIAGKGKSEMKKLSGDIN